MNGLQKDKLQREARVRRGGRGWLHTRSTGYRSDAKEKDAVDESGQHFGSRVSVGEGGVGVPLGDDGSEQIRVELNGSVIATETLDTSYTTYQYPLGASTSPEDVRIVFFNDNGPRNVDVDAIVIDGTRYETEAATTESLGSWSNGNCDQGFRESETLHCNGWIQYDQ